MHTSQCFGASSGFMPELKVAFSKQERNENIEWFPCTCETVSSVQYASRAGGCLVDLSQCSDLELLG